LLASAPLLPIDYLIVLMGAYFGGGPAAALAGMLYGLAESFGRLRQVEGSAAFGLLAGAFSGYVSWQMSSLIAGLPLGGFTIWTAPYWSFFHGLAIVSGAICGGTFAFGTKFWRERTSEY
jgi:hypothetical protein